MRGGGGGWLRRNWPWVAGGALLGVHVATWLMQRAVKNAVRSPAQQTRTRD